MQDAGDAAPEFEPIKVRFRLTTGIRVNGELTSWDADGIDGSFARRAWNEIQHEDVWRLHRQLMDREDARQWVNLGRVLLVASIDQPKAEKWSERAFRRALRIGEGDASGGGETAGVALAAIELLIADAREERALELRLRDEEAAAAKAERLRTSSPEGQVWGSGPWPALTEEQQTAAVVTMKRSAEQILEKVGMTLEPVETDYFLFYSDLPRRETARWAGHLDDMYARLAEQFELTEGENIFWGKAVIFVFKDRDRFRLVEADAFGQITPEWADGMCHPIGPRVFVSFYRPPADEQFAATLVHETVHGFLHRYRTPRRFPTWANEGICDYLASILFPNSPIDYDRRRKGRRYVRNGGDVGEILDMTYRQGSWPGPGEVGYGIGYLMIELMIREQPRPKAFADWVRAIKAGKNWELALQEDFGVGREHLVETFVRYYKVND